jgi:hypothetical protein
MQSAYNERHHVVTASTKSLEKRQTTFPWLERTMQYNGLSSFKVMCMYFLLCSCNLPLHYVPADVAYLHVCYCSWSLVAHATSCTQAIVLNAHAYMLCSVAVGTAVNLLSYNYTYTRVTACEGSNTLGCCTATTMQSIKAARCWSVCVTSAHQSTPIMEKH